MLYLLFKKENFELVGVDFTDLESIFLAPLIIVEENPEMVVEWCFVVVSMSVVFWNNIMRLLMVVAIGPIYLMPNYW